MAAVAQPLATAPVEPVLTLPSRCYTDPAIYAREMETIFRSAWQPFAHGCDVAAPGDYVAGELLGQDIVVLRGRDGALRGFHNVCRHRGHRLLRGTGNLKVAVTCPYHAWSYGLDGRLRAAPNGENVPGFDPSGIALTPVAVEQFCNLVLVNLDPDAAPFHSLFPGLGTEILAYAPRMAELAFSHRSEAELACNWKVAVENFDECYHCVTAHPTLMTGLLDPGSYRIELFERHHRHSGGSQSADSLIYRIDPSISPRAMDFASWLLWPNVALQVNPGSNYVVFHFMPLAHDRTLARIDWFFGPWVGAAERARIVEQHRATTLAEDVSLVAEVQRGLASRSYDRGVLMVDAVNPNAGNSEHTVAHLQQIWRSVMGEPAAA